MCPVTFDQFNVSFAEQIIYFHLTDPKYLNISVFDGNKLFSSVF